VNSDKISFAVSNNLREQGKGGRHMGRLRIGWPIYELNCKFLQLNGSKIGNP